MDALELLYFNWNEKSGRNQEIANITEEMDKVMFTIKQKKKIESIDFNKLDELIGDYGALSEKEGFYAGFKIAIQLLMGIKS